jgi:predicted transcriptional regulator
MLVSRDAANKTPRILLLSLHPVYARRFFDKTKQIELRRTRPRLSEGDLALFYVTAPEQAIGGGGRVRTVLELPPGKLWRKAGPQAGIERSDFDQYFKDCELGYGIRFERVWPFEPALGRRTIARSWPGFRPPQLYQYLSEAEVRRMGLRIVNRELRLLAA